MIYSVNFYQNFRENVIVFTVDNDPGSVYKVVDGVRTPISYTYNNQTLTLRFEQVGEFDVILNGEPKITHFENDFVIDDSSVDTSSDFGSPVLCEIFYNEITPDFKIPVGFVLPIYDHSMINFSLYNSKKEKVKYNSSLDYGYSDFQFPSNRKSVPLFNPYLESWYGYTGFFELFGAGNILSGFLDNSSKVPSIKKEANGSYTNVASGKYYIKLSNLQKPPGNDIFNDFNTEELYNQDYYFEFNIRDEIRQQYIDAVNALDKLSHEDKQGFIDRINVSTANEEMESIYAEAVALNNSSSGGGTDDPILTAMKQQYITAINGFAKLSQEEKQDFIDQINAAKTQQDLIFIYVDASTLNDSKP